MKRRRKVASDVAVGDVIVDRADDETVVEVLRVSGVTLGDNPDYVSLEGEPLIPRFTRVLVRHRLSDVWVKEGER